MEQPRMALQLFRAVTPLSMWEVGNRIAWSPRLQFPEGTGNSQ